MTVDDCKLLEAMNESTKEKYTQMSEMSQRLMKEMSKLQNTCNYFFKKLLDKAYLMFFYSIRC